MSTLIERLHDCLQPTKEGYTCNSNILVEECDSVVRVKDPFKMAVDDAVMATHFKEDLPPSEGDEELTSLAWLQDTNLLKNFQVYEEDSSPSDCLEDIIEQVEVAEEEECVLSEEQQNVAPLSPYNPQLHSHSKPPFSFSCLIFMAIEDSPRKALPVKDIYGWILQHFPYFQNAPTGWKNSVRHNLSLSKCFRKVDKEKGQNVGKGSLWCIDPEFRPNLLQALQKAPSMANLEFSHFFSSPCNGKIESEIKPCLLVTSQEAIQVPSPELFPFLSRRLASSMKDPEVDAAATMLTLKNGPLHNVSEESENDSIQNAPKFTRKRLRLKQQGGILKRSKSSQKPVITNSPSEDHTYSACLEGRTDVMPPLHNGSTREGSTKDEEGANALMNLAEIASKRLLRSNVSS